MGVLSPAGYLLGPLGRSRRRVASGVASTYSVLFDGVDDYVELGALSALTTFSVACWVWLGDARTYQLLFTSNTDSASAGIDLRFESSKLRIYSGGSSIASPASYGPGDGWLHVGATRDSGGNGALFVNGASVATGALSVPNSGQFGRALLGLYGISAGFYAKVMLDDFRLHNDALSAGDFASLYAAGDVQTNIVHYWPLENGSGVTATDTVGSNNGTLTGGPLWRQGVPRRISAYTPATSAGSLDLDGSSGYGSRSGLSVAAKHSVAGWVRRDGTSAWGGLYESNTTAGGSSYRVRFNSNTGVLRFENSSSTTIVGATTLSIGTWCHVCAVFDGASSKLYVNGALDASGDLTDSNTVSGFEIGRSESNSAQSIDGPVDDWQLYSNRALDANEASRLASGLATASNIGLTCRYNFDDASGATAADSSGNGNTLTLNGGYSWSASVPGNFT